MQHMDLYGRCCSYNMDIMVMQGRAPGGTPGPVLGVVGVVAWRGFFGNRPVERTKVPGVWGK